MTRPKIRFHDSQTDEVIDREMNDVEFEQYKLDKAAVEALQAEAEAKEIARTQILDRLGLTADEAAILLG